MYIILMYKYTIYCSHISNIEAHALRYADELVENLCQNLSKMPIIFVLLKKS